MTQHCPACGDKLLYGRETPGGPIRGGCKTHGYVSDALTVPDATSTAGGRPNREAQTAYPLTHVVLTSEPAWRDEAELVDASQKDLEARGCVFLRIQQRDARNAGSDLRLGDAFVKPPFMAIAGIGYLLEYKLRPIKFSSDKQREAAEDGVTIVVTSLEEARRAVGLRD